MKAYEKTSLPEQSFQRHTKVLYQSVTLMRGNLHANIMKADWSEQLGSYLKVLEYVYSYFSLSE